MVKLLKFNNGTVHAKCPGAYATNSNANYGVSYFYGNGTSNTNSNIGARQLVELTFLRGLFHTSW